MRCGSARPSSAGRAEDVTPLVAVWLDGTFHFCTGSREQKAIDLASNAHVILTTGCSTWDEGLDVVVEGEAERVTDDALLVRLADAWAQKWDGRWQLQVEGGAFRGDGPGAPCVYAVVPTKVLALGKGELSHTRRRF